MSVETTAARPSTTMSGQIVDSIGDIFVASLEATAQVSLGQGLLRFADRCLWVVEKSAQWSLPVQEVNSEENGKTFGKIELVRPLPWIFFLPSLVILRVCKIGINVGAVILGFPQLQTTGVVKFIQKGRRRLRAIKSNGLRRMRYRRGSRNKEEELSEAKKSLIKSMLSTLSALSCLETSRRTPSPTPTRVYVEHPESDTNATTPEPEYSTTESTGLQTYHKRSYSEVTGTDENSEFHSEEEATEAKLERLATEDSDADDHDYDPTAEELASESSTSDEDEEEDDYVSESEINDLRNACNLIAMEDVIVEEPEPEPEPEPEVETEGADKKSIQNKMTTDVPNDPEKETESKKSQDGQSTPGVTGTGVENSGKYFSPVSSPGEFGTPESKGGDSASAKTSLNKNASVTETSVDNGDIDSSSTSKISGTSPDGSTAIKTTNGATTDSQSPKKRNNGTGRSHRKGNKKSGSSQCKQA